MKTYNESFNRSWEYLSKFHPAAFPKTLGESLDLSIKPNVDKQEWADYMSNLINILVIGAREGFYNLHVDGKGRPAYLLVS